MIPRPARKLVALAALVAAAVVLSAPALSGPLTIASPGGLQGTRYVEHGADTPFEATEAVALDFSMPVEPNALKAAITIVPSAPFAVSPLDFGKRMAVRFRKVPGTTYRLTVAAGVRAFDGSTTAAPLTVTVRTANDAIPAPLRATPGEAYRYGILAHPYPFSLTGPNAKKIVADLAGAGVRFVRIDYCGDQIEAKGDGTYDWTIPDRVATLLAQSGITELPIVEQYCSPRWANGGFPYPAIWSNPRTYAAFAGAIATHVVKSYPRITRIELFNEPNLKGWWTNEGDAGYAARDGSATAEYMRAAYAAIKAAAPRLTVVGPALASGGSETDPRSFFDTMYANGCRRGACWDVISVHNYRWENPTFPEPSGASNRFDIYKSILDIAAKHGDAGTHVMLTEWGYSTIDSPDGVDPRTQARYVALGFNLMLADPQVDGIVYVNMQNPSADFWGQTALVEPDFTPKPAYDVYRMFATARSTASRSALSNRAGENSSAR